jgi:large subunit ribosomal protein L6
MTTLEVSEKAHSKTSRVGRKPIDVPAGVDIQIKASESEIVIKGPKGVLAQSLPIHIEVVFEEKQIKIVPKKMPQAIAISGTLRAIIANHVTGVTQGFTEKLQLVGVGYRAQVQQKGDHFVLGLTLGLSHPVSYVAPVGIKLASAVVTEIEVTGIDKQLVGQVAADIRSICGGIRRPEPYKGKGIRYANEKIILKETKKK